MKDKIEQELTTKKNNNNNNNNNNNSTTTKQDWICCSDNFAARSLTTLTFPTEYLRQLDKDAHR